MEQTGTIQTKSTIAGRPTFLTVICILSFIGSGLWTLFSLVAIFASGFIMEIVENFMSMGVASAENIDPAQMQQAVNAFSLITSMGTGLIIAFAAVSLVFALLSLWGVIRMWSLKRSGFWLYAVPNGLILLASLISFDMAGIIITGGFITMYALNLKYMNR